MLKNVSQNPKFLDFSFLKDFIISKPSVFISIPKRWVQLYETIEEIGSLDKTDESVIKKNITDLTGGQLKW